MTRDDETDEAGEPGEELRGIALDAWEPPEPRATSRAVADAVIARLRAPAPVAASELGVARVARPRRRWPIAVGVGAAAAAAAVVVAVGLRAPEPAVPEVTRGELVAARAAHLALGASAADLDPGAEVRWRRDGARIAADQPRGAVAWRASGGDTLVIDAGAAVASVEATGASLRVEVQMNRTDARVIGASAVTAAVVAMVTVIVYEGHVKVASAGRTVTVPPGATAEFPAAPDPRTAVGGGARSPEQATVADNGPTQSPDREAIIEGVAAVKPQIEACDDGSFDGKLRATIVLAASGAVASVAIDPPGSTVATCVAGVLRGARFIATTSGASFTYPFVFHANPKQKPAPAPRPACDAAGLAERALELYGKNKIDESIKWFELAYACKAEPDILVKTFMVACTGSRAAKAAALYKRISPAERKKALVTCTSNGITEAQLAGTPPAAKPCDVDALAKRGQDAFAEGRYEESLRLFDLAHACKPDASLLQKAFIVACNGRLTAKAGALFKRLSPGLRQQALPVCVRNGIAEPQLLAP